MEQVFQEQHKEQLKKLGKKLRTLFTEHPHEAGETFLEHWLFTMEMSSRFLYVSAVIFIHGTFPFLLKREGSKQIEKIYTIMKTRQPKNRPAQDCCIDYEI